jgi:hypothetical protein
MLPDMFPPVFSSWKNDAVCEVVPVAVLAESLFPLPFAKFRLSSLVPLACTSPSK